MVTVVRYENESDEALIKRFMKKVTNSGVLQEYKDHQAYEKPSDTKRKDKMIAKSRINKFNEKEKEVAAFENANKFRPRQKQDNRSRDNQRRPEFKKPQKVEQKEPEDKPSTEALKNLQDKFNKKQS